MYIYIYIHSPEKFCHYMTFLCESFFVWLFGVIKTLEFFILFLDFEFSKLVG